MKTGFLKHRRFSLEIHLYQSTKHKMQRINAKQSPFWNENSDKYLGNGLLCQGKHPRDFGIWWCVLNWLPKGKATCTSSGCVVLLCCAVISNVKKREGRTGQQYWCLSLTPVTSKMKDLKVLQFSQRASVSICPWWSFPDQVVMFTMCLHGLCADKLKHPQAIQRWLQFEITAIFVFTVEYLAKYTTVPL